MGNLAEEGVLDLWRMRHLGIDHSFLAGIGMFCDTMQVGKVGVDDQDHLARIAFLYASRWALLPTEIP